MQSKNFRVGDHWRARNNSILFRIVSVKQSPFETLPITAVMVSNPLPNSLWLNKYTFQRDGKRYCNADDQHDLYYKETDKRKILLEYLSRKKKQDEI